MRGLVLCWVGLVVAGCASGDAPAAPRLASVWVGDTSGALTVREVEPATGVVVREARADLGEPCSFLAFHPVAPWVYALGSESVQAFAYGPREPGGEPTLTRLGGARVGVQGTHLTLDQSGRYLMVASYGGHSITVLEVGANGAPGAVVQTLGGDGGGFCRNAHQVRSHPNNRFVYAPCLGSDGVRVMGLDHRAGQLVELEMAATAQGAGPRHMTFHPDRDVAYVLNELDSTLDVFDLDPIRGRLTHRQTVAALPDGASPSRSSDVQVRADGSLLVAVHREPRDEIVGFTLDDAGDPRLAWRRGISGTHARTCALAGSLLAVGITRSQRVELMFLGSDGRPPEGLDVWGFDGDVMCVLARME